MKIDILLIDDNRIDRMIATRAIRDHWPTATVRSSPYADIALAELRDEPGTRPDLILLDVRMPRMTGPEFLAASAGDDPPGIARAIFLMLTVPLPKEEARHTDHPAFRGTIDKPLVPADLDRIAAIMERQDSRSA